jgi:hypothetical protein
MTAPYFRASRKFMGPPWLVSNGESELVGYALDLLKDGFVERLRQGLLARLPQNDPTGATTAPDDALAAMGRDRRIRRGLNETPQAYARRLIRWIDDWKVAGNPFALMQQLAAYLGPVPSYRTVDVRGNWFSRAADGTLSISLTQANWDWDAASDALARWSRFWVVIYPNGFWTQGPNWGDSGAKWGTPERTWGSTATVDEVSTVRSIVADWKPAGTRCVNVILAFDGTSFNPATARDGTGLPDGTWGHWSKISGGAYVASRLSTARYLDGV